MNFSKLIALLTVSSCSTHGWWPYVNTTCEYTGWDHFCSIDIPMFVFDNERQQCVDHTGRCPAPFRLNMYSSMDKCKKECEKTK